MNKIIINQEPVLLKTKKYSTIDFSFIYPIKYDKKYLYYPDFLKNILITSCFDYKTEQEFRLEMDKRLIIRYKIIPRRYLNNIYIEFNFCLPNPKKIKYDISSAISLIMNSILKPNASDCSFNQDAFKREYDYYLELYNNMKVNNNNKIYRDFSKSVNAKLFNKYSFIANLKDFDKITSTSLYEYYEKNIMNNFPLVYVFGNITSNEVNNLLSPFIEKNIKPVKIPKDYYVFINPRKKTQYLEKKYKTSTSNLYLAYFKDNMKKEELIYYYFLIDIFNLNIGVSPLFKKLRVENNLIYDISASLISSYGVFYIETYLNVSKKDIVLKLINECFQELKKKEVIIKYQDLVIKMLKNNLLREKDSKYASLSNRITKDLELGYLESEYLEIYKNIDIDLFMEFLNELKLDTVYLAKGVLDERS